jgi:hypothetical protein
MTPAELRALADRAAYLRARAAMSEMGETI